jgi:hypothetical protein
VNETRAILGAQGRKLRVKHSELSYALTAQAWKPYFQRMCAAYASLPKERRTEIEAEGVLGKLGFDPQAVEVALQAGGGLTTADEGARHFAANRLNVGDDTVLAAHSKVYPKKRKPRKN